MFDSDDNRAGRHRQPDQTLFDSTPLGLHPIAKLRHAETLLEADIDAARSLINEAIAQLISPVTDANEGAVRRDAAPTSRKSAAAVAVRTGTQRARVLIHLAQHGPATDPELQQALGLSPNSERPRRRELVAAGFVADSGQTRKHHEADHAVWTATDTGRAAAGELKNAA